VSDLPESAPQVVLYPGRHGRPDFSLRVEGAAIWLTQQEIAALFQTTKQNVSLHARNIIQERELDESATVEESLTVQDEGGRQVRCRTRFYRLELGTAIGYILKSNSCNKFRILEAWQLREFMANGFLRNDKKFKQGKCAAVCWPAKRRGNGCGKTKIVKTCNNTLVMPNIGTMIAVV
jgi:hypothetical protein